MASLVPPNRKSKNYGIKFYFNGRQYHKSLKVSNKKDALILFRKCEMLLAQGIFPFSESLIESDTLQDFEESYLKYLHSRSAKYTEKSIYNYENSLRIFREFAGNAELSEITPRFVETELLPYLEENYKPYTVRHHMTSLRAIFTFAVKWELIPKNPFSGLVPRLPDKLPVYFTREEIQRIKDNFDNPDLPSWQRPYFLLMLNTGNRKTEHLNLKWSENIFLDENLIKFPGKGKKERLVPLNDESIGLLSAIPRRLGNDRVFYQIAGTSVINEAWWNARKKLGLKYRIHDFRSNYASWYMMSGGNLYDLMNILGWKKYETAKVYLNYSKEHIESKRNIVRF